MVSTKKSTFEIIGKVVIYIVLIFGAVCALFPFYWMVSSSFKQGHEIMKFPPTIFPQKLSFEHYIYVWENTELVRNFFNSVIVTGGVVFLNVFLSGLVAYALTKLHFPGRNLLFVIILAIMMIPFQLLMLPLFLMMDKYHLLNTYWSMILPSSISSFSIFLLRQAFISVPDDYIDAALIDGCSHIKIFFTIVIPLVKPMVLTVMLVNFYWSWNAFLWPMLVTTSDKMATLQVALARFRTFDFERWGAIMASCTITSLPIVITYLAIQRKFIESLAMTGIKG